MKIERKPFTSAFYIWNGMAIMFYSSHLTPFHSHNTLQLVFDIRESFKVQTQNSNWQYYKSLVIKENTIHRLDTNESVQLIIYIDPFLNAAEQIKSRFLSNCEISSLEICITDLISLDDLHKSLLNPNEPLLRRLAQQIIKKLINDNSSYNEDERIKKFKEFVPQYPEKYSIRILAQKVFLSESRLRALFKKQTGISIHRYILWNMIIRSISQLMNGRTIAEAALFSGFEDSSHLHKTTMKMFGLSPSMLIKNNKELNIVVSDSSPLKIKSALYNKQFTFQGNIVC